MKKLPYPDKRHALLALGLCVLCACSSTEHACILRHGESAPPAESVAPQPVAVAETRVAASTSRRTWKDERLLKEAGTRAVRIRLRSQRGELLVNGRIAMEFPVCTGRQDSTPEGTYRILEKDRNHRSNLYHVAMPYFMRLTYDGIGLHVGDVYASPVSHGCIRLTREACVPLYQLLPVGTEVIISRS